MNLNLRIKAMFVTVFSVAVLGFVSCDKAVSTDVEVVVSGLSSDSSVKLLLCDQKKKALDTVEVFANKPLKFTREWRVPQVIYVVALSDDKMFERKDPGSFLSLDRPTKLFVNIEQNEVFQVDAQYVGLPFTKDIRTRLEAGESVQDIESDEIKNSKDSANVSFDVKSLVSFVEYQIELEKFVERRNSLYERWGKLRQQYGDKLIPEEARRPLDDEFNSFYEEYSKNTDEYIASHNNIITELMYLTTLSHRLNVPRLDSLLQETPTQLKEGPYYELLQNRLKVMKSLQKGAVAPDFTMPDVDGNQVSLSSLRGNYVLLDFWASWCGYCRKENPIIKEAYAKYGVENNSRKGSKLDIIYVSLDNSREKWLEAIEQDELPWHHVSTLKAWQDPIVKVYDINGIPSPFLLDPEGKIVAKGNELRGKGLLILLDKILN